MIYLDNNASTPVDPEVVEVTASVLGSVYGNPSSSHAAGARAKVFVERARSQVAELLGVSSEEIFFTSGGTESNNLALIGLASKKGKGHIVTSSIEHPSVTNPCKLLERRGFTVTYVSVDRSGRVMPEEVKRALRDDTILVTIMHANNETGVLQPLCEIGKFVRERGIPLHTDAAQTVGKIALKVPELAVDMMTVVSHKFYGPKGVGALYVRRGLELSPILFGAGHEKGMRPGTENVPGIAGMGKACELAGLHIGQRTAHAERMTEALYAGLKAKIAGVRLNGHESMRLPNTLNLSVPGVGAFDLLEDVKDTLAASAGSACHSGICKPSPVLKAMGLSDEEALSSIRFSTGKDTTDDEIRRAIEILSKALQARKP